MRLDVILQRIVTVQRPFEQAKEVLEELRAHGEVLEQAKARGLTGAKVRPPLNTPEERPRPGSDVAAAGTQVELGRLGSSV